MKIQSEGEWLEFVVEIYHQLVALKSYVYLQLHCNKKYIV